MEHCHKSSGGKVAYLGMSHTTRILKEIASSEEYQSLSSAVEQGDYEAMFVIYTVILERL